MALGTVLFKYPPTLIVGYLLSLNDFKKQNIFVMVLYDVVQSIFV
jgi:hypothetical protein